MEDSTDTSENDMTSIATSTADTLRERRSFFDPLRSIPQAERALLSAALFDAETYERHASDLRVQHFDDPVIGWLIYGAVGTRNVVGVPDIRAVMRAGYQRFPFQRPHVLMVLDIATSGREILSDELVRWAAQVVRPARAAA